MPYQFNLIRFNGTYLTDNALVSGSRYISEITGLGALQRHRQSISILPLEGAPIRQFGSNLGLPLSINFPTLDTTTFNSMVAACNSSDDNGTQISLYISGEAGTFDLGVVSTGIEVSPATAISAGLKGARFDFQIADFLNIIVAEPSSITVTGAAASLTFAA